MTDPLRLRDESALFERLCFAHDEGRRHLFLVGSPLVVPGAPGVPGVAEMIRRVGEQRSRVTSLRQRSGRVALPGLGWRRSVQSV